MFMQLRSGTKMGDTENKLEDVGPVGAVVTQQPISPNSNPNHEANQEDQPKQPEYIIENLTAESIQSLTATLTSTLTATVNDGLAALQGAMATMRESIHMISYEVQKEKASNIQRFESMESQRLVGPSNPTPPTPAIQPPVQIVTAPTTSSRFQSLCGKPQVFDGQNLDNFLLTIDNFINSNEVEDNSRKLTILVSYLGPAITSYRTWIADNPRGSYEEFVDHLHIIYGATPATLMSKVKFRNMKRKRDQSLEQFLTELQDTALVAYKGQSSSSINCAVIEQFLLGLDMSKIQETLMREDFSSPVLLLQRAQKVRDSLQIVQTSLSSSSSSRVNAVASQPHFSPPHFAQPQFSPVRNNFRPTIPNQPSLLRCWVCNSPTHKSYQCPQQRPAPSVACHHCQGNHLVRNCPTRPSGNAPPGKFQGSANPAQLK